MTQSGPGSDVRGLRRWPLPPLGSLGAIAVALLVALPVLVVLSSLVGSGPGAWLALASSLPRYVGNSLALMLGVGLGVSLLGVPTAALVSFCRFPGRVWLDGALLLPLAVPAYLLAYTVTDLLDYGGPIQTALRDSFGWQSPTDYWFPEIRSLGGAIALFSLTLYPYVYLLTRASFLGQSSRTLEAARGLGCSFPVAFRRVALPLARPAIGAGLALALMETLSDFGTVQYFGVETFTTGIYRTWLGLGDRTGAAQLAGLLMLFALALILLERASRRQARFFDTPGGRQAPPLIELRGGWGWLATLACLLPLLLALALPLGVLVHLQLQPLDPDMVPDNDFGQLLRNTLGLATLSALLAVVLAVALAYARRLQPTRLIRSCVRIASLGYAVPGSVLAVGILLVLGVGDRLLSLLSPEGRAVLSGSLVGLVFAYLVRFLAVALSGIESGLEKIRPSLDEASRSLGESTLGTLRRIHLPLLRGSLFSALLLVFVDVIKELPATLVMRPFNYDTLAVRVYQYASDERLAEAAAPALTILLTALLPVLLLARQLRRTQHTELHL